MVMQSLDVLGNESACCDEAISRLAGQNTLTALSHIIPVLCYIFNSNALCVYLFFHFFRQSNS